MRITSRLVWKNEKNEKNIRAVFLTVGAWWRMRARTSGKGAAGRLFGADDKFWVTMIHWGRINNRP